MLKSGPHAYTKLFTDMGKHVGHTIGQAPTASVYDTAIMPALRAYMLSHVYLVHLCITHAKSPQGLLLGFTSIICGLIHHMPTMANN